MAKTGITPPAAIAPVTSAPAAAKDEDMDRTVDNSLSESNESFSFVSVATSAEEEGAKILANNYGGPPASPDDPSLQISIGFSDKRLKGEDKHDVRDAVLNGRARVRRHGAGGPLPLRQSAGTSPAREHEPRSVTHRSTQLGTAVPFPLGLLKRPSKAP